MKVIFDTAIVLKGKHSHTMLRKEIETALFPFPGVQIEDSAWKDPKVPTSIICSLEDGYYLLNFAAVELETEEQCNREVEMYRLHGWKRPNEWV